MGSGIVEVDGAIVGLGEHSAFAHHESANRDLFFEHGSPGLTEGKLHEALVHLNRAVWHGVTKPHASGRLMRNANRNVAAPAGWRLKMPPRFAKLTKMAGFWEIETGHQGFWLAG
jgi:hypothetical protein